MAPGYEVFRQSVQISSDGDQQFIYATLTPLAGFKNNSGPVGPPILAPNAQKELNKALETLRADKLDEARKHLEKLARSAPSNPDVNYLWGMYYAQSKDWTRAQGYWEKAIQFSPHHGFSLAALGQLSVQNGDFPKAIDYLTRAVEASPSSWRNEQQLAEAYLLHDEAGQVLAEAPIAPWGVGGDQIERPRQSLDHLLGLDVGSRVLDADGETVNHPMFGQRRLARRPKPLGQPSAPLPQQ